MHTIPGMTLPSCSENYDITVLAQREPPQVKSQTMIQGLEVRHSASCVGSAALMLLSPFCSPGLLHEPKL